MGRPLSLSLSRIDVRVQDRLDMDVRNYKSNRLTVRSSLLFELDRRDAGEFHEHTTE